MFPPAGLLLGQRALGAFGQDRVWWGVLTAGVLFVSLDAARRGLVVLAAVGLDSWGPDLADAPERRLETWYVLKTPLEEVVELLARRPACRSGHRARVRP